MAINCSTNPIYLHLLLETVTAEFVSSEPKWQSTHGWDMLNSFLSPGVLLYLRMPVTYSEQLSHRSQHSGVRS